MIVNILYFDMNKFAIFEVSSIFQNLKKALPEDSIILAMPQGIQFLYDINIEQLKDLRETLDNVIKEKEKDEN